MTPKQFQKYMARDGGCCHCGDDVAVVPNHRINRGMGGSKERDVPSNILVICSFLNERIERDPFLAEEARLKGWKLESWQDPLTTPYLDERDNEWYLLDNDFNRKLDRIA